jgi:Bacterial Ig domain
MRAFLTRAFILSSALLMAATASAQTQGLARVGPTSPTNGFPDWYQDKTGMTLEFCQPLVQGDLDGGWCLLLPADTTVPEVFPTQFADEHFYYAADAQITSPAIPSGALLVIGLEAAFAVGPVVQGDQIVFARIRIRFDAPQSGTYTVYHPYGVNVLTAAAGERVFYTEDIGIQCLPGQFDCALQGRIGPFLLASNAPGGAELPGLIGPSGKLHIADPARLGPVTGSPVTDALGNQQNYFRIVGPGGTVLGETTNFVLMGRVFSGTLPGAVTINKARYGRAQGSPAGKVDVFATAFTTAQPRLPGAPPPANVAPVLGFYPAACGVGAGGALAAPAGIAIVDMFNAGSRYYGQFTGAIPAAVCVKDYTARDASGQIVPVYKQANVTDQVTITEAVYNPANSGTLRVAAISSDLNIPPTLTAAEIGSFLSGTFIEGIVGVPPLMALVTSTAGGRAELEVSTLAGVLSSPGTPVAGADTFTLNEDSGTNSLNVLANDTFGGVLIDPAAQTVSITITQAPTLGVAVVNDVTKMIEFTPTQNAFGSTLLTYTVSVNGSAPSPAAFVSLTINPINDAPVANNDSATGVGNIPISINLLANDTDVDGAADKVGVNIVTAPAGLTFTVVGGTLSFTAPSGTYAFTYQARDAAGALSNVANVNVTLTGGETLAITRAQYIANKRRWRVEGTSTVTGTQTVYIMYANGTFLDGTTAVGYLIGTAQVDAAGAWALDFALAGANDPRNPTSGLFNPAPTAIYAITTLGGSSPITTFQIR